MRESETVHRIRREGEGITRGGRTLTGRGQALPRGGRPFLALPTKGKALRNRRAAPDNPGAGSDNARSDPVKPDGGGVPTRQSDAPTSTVRLHNGNPVRINPSSMGLILECRGDPNETAAVPTEGRLPSFIERSVDQHHRGGKPTPVHVRKKALRRLANMTGAAEKRVAGGEKEECAPGKLPFPGVKNDRAALFGE